jgi:nucleoside-diphosphate-sugar epimerase
MYVITGATGHTGSIIVNRLLEAGKAVGRPGLRYMQAPYAMVEQTMMQSGMSQSTARLLNEMARGFNDGVIKAQEPRSAENTTPTELERFAQEVFAPAFQGKAAGP